MDRRGKREVERLKKTTRAQNFAHGVFIGGEVLSAALEKLKTQEKPNGEKMKIENHTETAPSETTPLFVAQMRAEDATQLVGKIADLRAQMRLLAADAQSALSPALNDFAPEECERLRADFAELSRYANALWEGARQLERRATLGEGAHELAIWDAEERELENEPPDAKAPVKLSPACRTLRREFFAAAKKVGLITRHEVRPSRLAAMANFIGRPIASTDEFTQDEWTQIVYATQDGRLEW